MNDKNPLVCIILVNYNGYLDTCECVKSLSLITYDNYKVIIVDNASNDANLLKSNEELNNFTEIVYLDENTGFSGGNNVGIEYAKKYNPEYYLLLNNDTVVDKDFLNQLIYEAEKSKDIGIVTGNIYYYTTTQECWYSCGEYDTETGLTNMCNNSSEENKRDITFACGCLMLIRKEMVHAIGFLDETFFLYSEDTEYCCRARKNGWKISWTAKSKIWHKVSVSIEENSAPQQYYLLRNNIRMIQLYGTNRLKAYRNYFVKIMKDLLKKRIRFQVVIWALSDAHNSKFGKTNRF